MKAVPIIAGRVYRVSYRGSDVLVLAVNPCAAICAAIDMVSP